MKNVFGVLLILVGALLFLAGAFSLITTVISLMSSSVTAYSVGFYLGRGLVGVVLLLLGWSAFRGGRRRISGATIASRS